MWGDRVYEGCIVWGFLFFSVEAIFPFWAFYSVKSRKGQYLIHGEHE